jgi:hypothetical protein
MAGGSTAGTENLLDGIKNKIANAACHLVGRYPTDNLTWFRCFFCKAAGNAPGKVTKRENASKLEEHILDKHQDELQAAAAHFLCTGLTEEACQIKDDAGKRLVSAVLCAGVAESSLNDCKRELDEAVKAARCGGQQQPAAASRPGSSASSSSDSEAATRSSMTPSKAAKHKQEAQPGASGSSLTTAAVTFPRAMRVSDNEDISEGAAAAACCSDTVSSSADSSSAGTTATPVDSTPVAEPSTPVHQDPGTSHQHMPSEDTPAGGSSCDHSSPPHASALPSPAHRDHKRRSAPKTFRIATWNAQDFTWTDPSIHAEKVTLMAGTILDSGAAIVALQEVKSQFSACNQLVSELNRRSAESKRAGEAV